MASLQRAGDPVLEDFFEWRRGATKLGIIHRSPQANQPFLPYTSIVEYFEEPDQIERLLRALFYDRDPTQLPNAQAIKQTHARVFCILLCTGRGPLIEHFTRYAGLDDRHLPFEDPPKNFPTTPEEPYFFNTFQERQWEFCAPEIEYREDIHFGAREVLPIIAIKQIGGGGSAYAYKIVLHSAYNQLLRERVGDVHSKDETDHTFVLKTYHDNDAHIYYMNEVSSFKRLRDCPTMIGFFGSFRQNGTYNILLEYADGGTLEDYFRNARPPNRGEDICNFWARFLGIVDALMPIHNEDEEDAEGPQILQGWHQDVKPQNILLKSSKSRLRYDQEFKLADLGTSHFKKKTTSSTEITSKDAHGTRTYGAPECYRGNLPEKGRLRVKRNVDVWSLGCVLSETAVWLVNGFEALEEYRIQRKQATDRIPGFQDGDCFHDGSRVLATVVEAHAECVANKRDRDYVTKPLLKLVDEWMLISPLGRLTAQQIYTHSQGILDGARRNLAASQGAGPCSQNRELSDASHNPQGRPQTPPELPPEMQDSRLLTPHHNRLPSVTNQRSHQKPDVSQRFNFGETSSIDSQLSPEDHLLVRRTEQSQLGATDQMPYQSIKEEGRQTEYVHDAHNNIGPEYPVSSRPKFAHGARTQRVSDPLPPRALYGESSSSGRPNHKRVANSLDETRVISEDEPHPESQFRHPPPPGSRKTSCRNQDMPKPQGFQHRPLACFLPSEVEVSTAHGDMDSQLPLRQNQRLPPPHWSVNDAIKWKNRAKMMTSLSLPEPHLFEGLKGRDCIFLIDDAESMKGNWEEVKKMLDLLGYIVKRFDPDGVEVFFTMSREPGKSRKFKKAKELVKELTGRQPRGKSNMKDRLGELLQAYRQRLEQPIPNTSMFKSRAAAEPRCLNIYIFTDGDWQPESNVEPHIRSMVDCLEAHQLLNAQVGIQFIQFGENPEGTKRLEYLDSEMYPRPKQDLVDNEPSDGNVFKMLFGAINKWFDDDPIAVHNNGNMDDVPETMTQKPMDQGNFH